MQKTRCALYTMQIPRIGREIPRAIWASRNNSDRQTKPLIRQSIALSQHQWIQYAKSQSSMPCFSTIDARNHGTALHSVTSETMLMACDWNWPCSSYYYSQAVHENLNTLKSPWGHFWPSPSGHIFSLFHSFFFTSSVLWQPPRKKTFVGPQPWPCEMDKW